MNTLLALALTFCAADGPAPIKLETTIDLRPIALTADAEKKRDAALDQVGDLPRNAPADLLFRVSELYWEKAKYQRTINNKKEADRSLTAALRLYERLLTEYPTYARNDEVLFLLSLAARDDGHLKIVANHYWTLIKQFPDSRFVPEAYIGLGVHFWNGNNYDKARKAFERAAPSPDPRVANYALYRLAWCEHKLDYLPDSVATLQKVIAQTKSDPKLADLHQAATTDLPRFQDAMKR